jgi:hypothetical protein
MQISTAVRVYTLQGYSHSTLDTHDIPSLLYCVVRMGEKRTACKLLMRKPQGKRLVGRPRHRCVDNINMHLAEYNAAVWTGKVWLRLGTSGKLL